MTAEIRDYTPLLREAIAEAKAAGFEAAACIVFAPGNVHAGASIDADQKEGLYGILVPCLPIRPPKS